MTRENKTNKGKLKMKTLTDQEKMGLLKNLTTTAFRCGQRDKVTGNLHSAAKKVAAQMLGRKLTEEESYSIADIG